MRYHSVQYRISGCPKVSITKNVQKKAMDFFRVRREYGSGGGSLGKGPFPSSIGAVIEWRTRESELGSNQEETERGSGGVFIWFSTQTHARSRFRTCWNSCKLFCRPERGGYEEGKKQRSDQAIRRRLSPNPSFCFFSRNRKRRSARVLPLPYNFMRVHRYPDVSPS